MKRTGILALVVLAAGIGLFFAWRVRNSDPPGMAPLMSLRQEMKGKTPGDVAKIVIQGMPIRQPIVVKRKADIAPLLESMQEAYVEEPQCACAGPTITVYWKGGGKTYGWGFCVSDGPKCAFGPKFAEAYNRVAPADWKIDMNKQEEK